VSTVITDLDACLHERFGLDQFRPGQREVIEAVIARRDCLCVMPTGGGKSLCYQLPSLLIDGVTLVVSPLIALMKDQVDGLVERGIRATLVNSTVDTATQNERIVAMERGAYDLVYIAPERFRSARFSEAIARTRVALLAVDEAHCISEWGPTILASGALDASWGSLRPLPLPPPQRTTYVATYANSLN
jgi:ATP-dependent DNA helicase RecQ